MGITLGFRPDLIFDPPKIAVKCSVCQRVILLHGPRERVEFLLKTMTSCPCGSIHETLPSASEHCFILS